MSRESHSLPFVSSVLHPTDFSAASAQAFVHALAVALIHQTRLTILHAGESDEGSWTSASAVRPTLERWGLLAPGSPKSAVFEELSMRVAKIGVPGDPLAATLHEVTNQQADLIVMATEGRSGIARFLHPSIGQHIGRASNAMGAATLFVPAGARGFVRPSDGRLELHRILVPVDHSPDPSEVLIRATRAAKSFGEGDVEITVLHVGADSPDMDLPPGDGWSFREVRQRGDVIPKILAAAEHADLIAMATEGRSGIFDALRGSFSERIVREAKCPVLAVPRGNPAGS